MKTLRLLGLSLFVLCVSVPAFAQTSIAVLDVQRILAEAKAAKNIQAQINKERETFVKTLSDRESKLREKEQALLAEAKSLAPEALKEKQMAFEKEFQEARLFAQKGKQRIDKALVAAMAELRENLFEVVEEISADKGYDLVLARRQVVVGGRNLDISDETLEKLNKTVSKITLNFDQE